MQRLLDVFGQSPAARSLTEHLGQGGQCTVAGVVNSARALLAILVNQALNRTVILVLDDEPTARACLSDTSAARPDARPVYFDPALHGLQASIAGACGRIIVAPASSLARPAPLPRSGSTDALTLRLGAAMDLGALVRWLDENAYERADLVTEPGEYATRGGIVDVFPDNQEAPVRVEFTADRVESVRTFDPLLQRSRTRLDTVSLQSRVPVEQSELPASTLLPGDAVLVTEGAQCDAFARAEITGEPDADFDLGCSPAGSFVGNIEQLRAAVRQTGQVFVVCSSEQQCARLSAIIGPGPTYLAGPLSSGFANPGGGYLVLTEREIYGTPFARQVRHRFKGLPIDNVVALRPGDHVVHIDYGVGRFDGTRRMVHGAVEKDYAVLTYAHADKVYVPVENLGLLDRYAGGDEATPTLDRLGGRAWLIAKAKAAKASAEYAQELLDIYARRSVARGASFGPDGPWQAELEASFPYEETPDQLHVLAEVKRDMEQARPMDRLVCGDVGYGKTEIALRAAFKAVTAGRQVALLAPTTILSYQHFVTFRRRLSRFPLRVEMLSRFVGAAKQADVVRGLADGTVDIVIGTHLLLGARVRFRDLGLVIIDEEQKFGVRQKERIRSLRTSVDVLTLTATPIPRTLYMGMAGLRDISQINTPPPGRREILTEVSQWNDRLIHDYVQRELDRGGQVFFVHNEIQSIQSIARKLTAILPGVTLAVGHGQMSGRGLADIYLGFAAGDFPLLLSTAIIESGLDMPNVNTIIVNRADRFGLSDLHQLRGRVGRSREQAYALFLVPGDAPASRPESGVRNPESEPAEQVLRGDARKRLSALLAYSRLGSGFKLALRDMEIRGVGNILGTQQHGHVARVGFNLYTQLLREAVARLKGEEVAVEPELKLDVSAYVPTEYIADAFERVAIYKRLLAVDTEDELAGLQAELVDRFGRYPAAVEPLFQIAQARLRARKLGLLKVTLKAGVSTVVGQERTQTVPGGIEGLLAWLAQAR